MQFWSDRQNVQSNIGMVGWVVLLCLWFYVFASTISCHNCGSVFCNRCFCHICDIVGNGII